MAGRPSGTVTFLLTDVEGSTQLWEERPGQMVTALQRHDRALRRAIELEGGFVFSTAGDAYAAAFASAGAAIMAAVAAQRELADVGLAVRMGLHTGEAHERDGDYFGPVVNRAARIMAAAHGAQILCSSITAELARGSATDVELIELGAARLKDLLEPEHLVHVVAPGLRTDFPPIRALDVHHHNLPVQRTALLGREEELGHLLDLIAGHRLVTLTGVGGCGKTRLAIAAAAEIVDDFPDGVYVVELAAVSDGAQVPEAVADAIGARVSGAATLASLAASLPRRRMLLVLDNCEHLLDGVAELVETLLSAGANLQILVTSREALEVEGEQSHRVASLAAEPALALLLERAAEAKDVLDLHDDDLRAAAELCERLDGLPLAIELAAAQLTAMSPAELLDRLDRRFELLVGGRRRRRQRHETLRAVMDWSWDLLDAEAQRVLAVLVVFSGGWTMEAAESVCARFTDQPVGTLLRTLVAKSMVEPVSTPTGTRFRMLETVRLFAQERLVETGLAGVARQAHVEWLLSHFARVPLDERCLRWREVQWFRSERDNVFLAIGWALDHDDVEAAVEILISGLGAWHLGVGSGQVLHLARRLLASDKLTPPQRARVLTSGFIAAVCVADHETMHAWEEEASACVAPDDVVTAAIVATWLLVPAIVPSPAETLKKLTAVEEQAASSGSLLTAGYVRGWRNLVVVCVPDGDVDLEWDPDDYGGPDSWGWMLGVQTAVLHEAWRGRPETSHRFLSLLDNWGLWWLGYRALVASMTGDVASVRPRVAEAVDDMERTGDVQWRAEMVLALGVLMLREGQPVPALAYLAAIRRVPMFSPIFYALRRRYADRARAELDDDAVAAALEEGRRLSVSEILARELPVATG